MRPLHLSILFAVLLIALQLISGIYLFVEKIGLLPSDVMSYYGGEYPKSFLGLLEVAVPHLLAIGTVVFVYAHFLLFTNIISKAQKHLFIYILFILAFLDILMPFFISQGSVVASYIKLISFFGFEFMMSVLLVVLLRALSSTSK